MAPGDRAHSRAVEVPVEYVPFYQKVIIRQANRANRPVFVATNLLESMVTNRRPTIAEVNGRHAERLHERSDPLHQESSCVAPRGRNPSRRDGAGVARRRESHGGPDAFRAG